MACTRLDEKRDCHSVPWTKEGGESQRCGHVAPSLTRRGTVEPRHGTEGRASLLHGSYSARAMSRSYARAVSNRALPQAEAASDFQCCSVFPALLLPLTPTLTPSPRTLFPH